MSQVHNRDLSVLVLEEFVALWRAETAAAAPPAPADPSPAVAPDEATAEKPAGAPKADADATADAPSRRGKRGVGARVLGGGGSGLRVLDALSASGLRAIRYAKEVCASRRIISRRVCIPVAVDPSDSIGPSPLG